VDVGVPGGERGNVQTGRGDRMSTISLLGCSTSVALARGPTDKEEERGKLITRILFDHSVQNLLNSHLPKEFCDKLTVT
jgi:hypothetical protein